MTVMVELMKITIFNLRRLTMRLNMLFILLFPALLNAFELDVNYGALASRPSVRDLGSGEAFTPVPEIDNSLYSNPASLYGMKLRMAIPEVVYIANHNLVTTLAYLVKNKDKLDVIDGIDLTGQPDSADIEIIKDLRKTAIGLEGKWVKIGLSPNVYVVYKNFGIGFYAMSHVNVMVDLGITSPKVFARAHTDFVLTGGYSRQLLEKYKVGLSLRYIERRTTDIIHLTPTDFERSDQIVTDLIAQATTPLRAMTITPGVITSFFDGKVLVGAVLQDLINFRIGEKEKRDEAKIVGKPNIKIGGSYTQNYENELLRHAKVGVSVSDIFNLNGNYYMKNLHLGGEVKVLAGFVRAGLNGGLPSIGLGLDLWWWRADYVFFGKERSATPWENPSWNHMISFRTGW